MNIITSNFESISNYTGDKISLKGRTFYAVYVTGSDGKLKLSFKSDEVLVILNCYSLDEIILFNDSELKHELEKLATWGLKLADRDELVAAYVDVKRSIVQQTK